MEHCCIPLIPAAIIFLTSLANGAVEEGREYVPYIENEIELVHERHIYADFRYVTASTGVTTDYDQIPEDNKATLREAHGIKECATQFKIRFPFYKNSKRPVCLYRDTTWVVPKNSTIDIDGELYGKAEFINEVHPVRGFVVNEMNSLVRGYIIEGNFYGIIRIFDDFYAYHLHFYIEPIDNLDIYTDHPIDEDKKNEDHNAIIFEYGANGEHEQERPPEDVAKQLYEKIRNATGGPVLTEVGRLAGMNDNDRSEPHTNKAHDHSHHHHNIKTGGEHESVSQQRKEATANEMDDTPEKISLRFHDDVAGAVNLQGGVSSSDILDTATRSSYLCTLCVWIQPLFAKKFGFKSGEIFGASEIIAMLKRMDWLFRAMDFNVDSVAENFGFRIKSIYVSDKIHVGKKKPATTPAPDDENSQTRKRRSVEEEDTPTPVVREEEAGAKNRTKKKLPKGKRTYNDILRQMKELHEFSECCATVAFVYIDMTPVLSVSTLRGLCSKENLVLVSGIFFGHKVGIYDIQRALFHGFGHMLGATHDKSLRARCQDRKPAKFYNPFLMHPVQQANVGLRPNSYKLSFCSKLEVTGFLDSNNLKCLVTSENDRFCGNGMLDPGEECDCGSAWQCHLEECCGESDTIFNCKPVKLGRRVVCERPMQW